MERLERNTRNWESPTYLASLNCGSQYVDCVVRNLTSGGAMFESDCQITAGDKVILDIPGLGQIASTVAWSIDTRAGVRFDEPRP